VKAASEQLRREDYCNILLLMNLVSFSCPGQVLTAEMESIY